VNLPSPDLNLKAQGWQWQNWEGLPYLTCSLLENWRHGFFTQQFSPRSPEELVKVFQPTAQVYRVKQVHGNRVVIPEEIAPPQPPNGKEKPSPILSLEGMVRETTTEGDGIISQESDQSVWVATADCTPVLIGDVITGRVAAVHAGWRGTAKGIVKEAIARFLVFGSSLENLRIALGPAISGSVYQVSEEVAVEVGASLFPPNTPVLPTLQQLPHSPILNDSCPGKVRLDVRRVIELQLEQLGINSQQIACAPFCTYQHQEYFFSYRRTGEKRVQWSSIVSL